MEDECDMKLCTNCERQIPAANYTIHSVHCARNLKICEKCKEPFPVNDMKKHLEHVPCKQCGERMQVCDVSPHQREACPQTSVNCTFCDLQLARTLMRDHETYCGTRTERCDECGELVMIKYRRLHEDSNHGFVKLDDEPGPQPSWVSSSAVTKPTTKFSKPSASVQPAVVRATNSVRPSSQTQSSLRNIGNRESPTSSSSIFHESAFEEGARPSLTSSRESSAGNRPAESLSHRALIAGNDAVSQSLSDQQISSINARNVSNMQDRFRNLSRNRVNNHPSPPATRNPAQSSANIAVKDTNWANGKVEASKGPNKKYPAPKPPNSKKPNEDTHRNDRDGSAGPANAPTISRNQPPAFKHTRDVPMYAAAMREQNQAKEREEQTRINMEQGLPPVLSPAGKLEKLQKMSALQNLDSNRDWRPPKNRANQETIRKDLNMADFLNRTPMSADEFMNRMQRQNLNTADSRDKNVNVQNINYDRQPGSSNADAAEDLWGAPLWGAPSTSLYAATGAIPKTENRPRQMDRFSEIKNNLCGLRKELKECTTPLEGRRPSDTSNTQQRPKTGGENPLNIARIADSLHEFSQLSQMDRMRNDLATGNQQGRTGATLNALERRVSPASGNNDNRRNDKNLNQNSQISRLDGQASGRRLVPCEFCLKLVPSIEVKDHEIYCEIRMKRVEDERRGSRDDTDRIRDLLAQPQGLSQPQAFQPLRPPRNTPADEFSVSDLADVMLPCEFCQEMIPANMFVTHETGCNPEETSLSPPASLNRTPERETNVLPTRQEAPMKNINLTRANSERRRQSQEEQQERINHPAGNVQKSNSRVKNKNRHANRHRNEEFVNQNVYDNTTHVINRDRRDDINAEGNLGYGDADDDEVELPCEFCMAPMRPELLMLHQQNCQEAI